MGPSNKLLLLTTAAPGVRLLDVREESRQRLIVAEVLEAHRHGRPPRWTPWSAG